MNAAQLLLKAIKAGVKIKAVDGKLRITPAEKITSERTATIKAHKSQLLTLLADLEAASAQDDMLVLEALALFNGKIATGTCRQTAFAI
jgi:TubC N-terminal docking domain